MAIPEVLRSLALALFAASLLLSGPLAAAPRVARTDAKYLAHVSHLKTRLPRGVFTIMVQRPFVVVGDGTPDEVVVHAQNTVGWAVRLLRQDYFPKDPDEIIDIYLFKDKQSYEHYNRVLFDEEPTTPYGYFSDKHNALVMNIATGGGTLVHEIVHPYIHKNFPACPPWFNEGLASLYEQCGERNGHIYGFPNWRLPGLQEAIRNNTAASFPTLMCMSTTQFYANQGPNYSVARYLCYHLQESGLLREYYRAFVKNHRRDPTGIETLRQVLRQEDMNSFRKRWEAFVLSLSYP